MMAWNSTLERKTPLRAKTGFKRHQPHQRMQKEQSPKTKEKSSPGANRKPRRSVKSSLETHLDIVFSLYIRLRDAMDGGLTRCISCGELLPFGQMQCGHYFTRHNRSVRWDEENCHSQCVVCNCHKSGNLDGYTPNLIMKIGQEHFDALNVRAHGIRKWSGDELREMIKHYTAEVKKLSKQKGINVKI